jgi:hypothetical protein
MGSKTPIKPDRQCKDGTIVRIRLSSAATWYQAGRSIGALE